MQAERSRRGVMPPSISARRTPAGLPHAALRPAVLMAWLTGTLVLAACTVGPDYRRPVVAVPAQYKEAAPGWKTAQPTDAVNRGAWWEVFNDPQLNALEERVASANQTVASFAAAYRQANALVSEANAAYFPTLGLSGSESRSKSSSSSFTTSSGTGTTTSNAAGRVSNAYSASLSASWEPDLWGKVRREVAGEKDSAQSAAANLANAQLSAQGTLAQTYFQLRALDSAQQLLDQTVAADQKSYDLTRNRYNQGVAARSDVLTAQTQLQQAQSAAIDNGILRAQYEHAIAVLVGEPASTFSLPPALLTTNPPPIPVQLPSSLLERRPDVAAAERTAAAANEQIGVAISAYYPNLTLSASGGYQSSTFSNWLTAPARFWTLGPQLAATLFDGGLRAAQTSAARASYDESVATYRATVLSAFSDVENNLASLRILEQEIDVNRAAAQSADQALEIALNQYKAGTGTYLQVIVAQTTAYSAHRTLVNTVGSRMVAAAGLIKALGGGWDVSDLPGAAAQGGTAASASAGS